MKSSIDIPTFHLRDGVEKGGLGGSFVARFSVYCREVYMKHYWDLVGASSEALLYRTHTFRELCLMGYYYTVSSASRCRKCDMTRASIGAILVSRFDDSRYREEVLSTSRGPGPRPARTAGSPGCP